MDITKAIKIVPPEGYEIDEENSTCECIKFKSKSSPKLTYEDVARVLFRGKQVYYPNMNGGLLEDIRCEHRWQYPTNTGSKKQLQKLLAINQLMNTAKFLNCEWNPTWDDDANLKWTIKIKYGKIQVGFCQEVNTALVYFKSERLALRAVDILGEDTIKLALSTDW